jgi:hypothetical protein
VNFFSSCKRGEKTKENNQMKGKVKTKEET